MAKSKLKLPKRIAGVKIPKKIRKGPVGQFLNSSAGQLLVAEALIAAGGAFFASEDGGRKSSGVVKRLTGSASERGTEAQQVLERGSARLAFAFSEAVRAFRKALGDESMTRSVTGVERESDRAIEPEVTKKKSSPPDQGAPH